MKTNMKQTVMTMLALILQGLSNIEATKCYSSTTEIDMEELELIRQANYDSSTLPPRHYTLCPDTVISIGSGTSFENWVGEYPLVPVNPNMHIQCGESGSSENKCTLFGSDTQVQTLFDYELPDSNIKPDSSNFTIQGVTFQGADGTNMNFYIHGENIVIQDCHFLDNSGDTTVHFQVRTSNQNDTITAEIVDCTFKDNRNDAGVVETSDGGYLSIKRSLFESNTVSCNDDCGVLRLRDGSGSIQDCCFLNNSYSRAAIYIREGDYTFSGNFGDNNPIPEPTCLDILDNECREFDSDICLIPEEPTTSGSATSMLDFMSCAIAVIIGAGFV